jgi:hypothetical protein
LKTSDIDVADTAGEAFRDATDQPRVCPAEDQELGRVPRPVGEHPENLEEFWKALDLVDDDEALERLEGVHRSREPCQVGWVFEVEKSRMAAPGDRSGEGRLAGLARTEQGHDGIPHERLPSS